MATSPKLAILLSTYNGGKFLKEQLDSLLGQTYTNFIIVVRDDGSADDSVEILQGYADGHPDRFHLVGNAATDNNDSDDNLGACGSFSLLMDYVFQHKTELGLEQAYMMFCDQDDVWYENKIERELQCMLETEAQLDQDAPALVHSDLAVVSENQDMIAISFTRYQGLETERNSFCNLAISNLVTGCTALINEAAARKALPIPEGAIMHDWWLGLVAAGFGQIVFIDAPLVYYRQHGSNTIGAKEHQQATLSDKSFLHRLLSIEPNEHLFEVAEQAAAFLERYGGELAEHEMRGLIVATKMKSRIGLLQRMHFRRARRY
jgi:hypothetical protein